MEMSTENINFLMIFLYKGESSLAMVYTKMFTKPMIFKFVLSFLIYSTYSQIMKPEFFEKNSATCQKILKNPHFDIDIVVGKPWRIYYTWNLKLDTRCLDMVFKNVTRKMVKRIWSDMYEYLDQQPIWEAATLHVSLGSARHELLLFADQGAAGSFLAVPNVVRDANMSPLRKTVPLLKFHMKLLRGGKYLLVMDCHVGGTSLAARPETRPYRTEVAAEAAALDLGDGYPACIKDKNKDEQFFVK